MKARDEMGHPDPEIDGSQAPAFCYAIDSEKRTHGLHSHLRHNLVYAIHGILHIKVDSTQILLPPLRAVWMPSGVPHSTDFMTRVSLRTICFDPDFPGVPNSKCRIFSVPPLLREMILHSVRWGVDRDPNDSTANLFFQTMAALCHEWMAKEHPFRLPMAKSPALAAATEYTLANLREVRLKDVAKVANLSARTLRRRMNQETGQSWYQFLHKARMMRAMELLAANSGVTETALDVGYNSLSGFTQAFTRFTGETPSKYRQNALTNV